MVQPQMDWDRFRNIINLVLVEPNRIRNSIHACIRLLFANFLRLQKVTYMHLPFNDVRYSPYACSDINYFLFFAADVKCGLYEINKKKHQSKC